MTRWLPFPLMALSLLVMWLLLHQTLAPGHVILGSLIGIGGAWALTRLGPPAGRLRRPRAMLTLAILVLHDIVRSNIAVARIILGPRAHNETSGFLEIPLELRAPYGLAVLALIVTATPGTLWVAFDSANGVLTLHVLDLIDEDAWIATIKQRYERHLLEIFE
ncbi:MAG: Na+/H+ antiporter subunit E [Geminicoccaceae bacterium]